MRKYKQILGSCERAEKNMWNVKVMVIPILVSSTRTVPNGIENILGKGDLLSLVLH